MFRRVLVCVVALAAVAAVQPARAQTVFGCPAGQALQSVQRNGSLVCIPVPAPVDLAPLELQIPN